MNLKRRYNREYPFETAMGSYEAARKTSKKVINFFVVGLTYGCRRTDNLPADSGDQVEFPL